MIVIQNKPIAYFDVDGTLLVWSNESRPKTSVKCEVIMDGHKLIRYYIPEHVKELKLQRESGTTIVVWSAAGSEWAMAVVTALKLEGYVTICMPKPHRIYDDKDPIEWLPKRRYFLDDNEKPISADLKEFWISYDMVDYSDHSLRAYETDIKGNKIKVREVLDEE